MKAREKVRQRAKERATRSDPKQGRERAKESEPEIAKAPPHLPTPTSARGASCLLFGPWRFQKQRFPQVSRAPPWPECGQNHGFARFQGPVLARTWPKLWLLQSFKASVAKNSSSKFQSFVLARTWPKLRLLHGSKALSWPERGHND